MTSELLLEVRTDPLAADLAEDGVQRLKNALVAALREARLAPKQSATGFTSRRFLVLFRGLTEEGTDQERVAVGEVVRRTVEGLHWDRSVRWGAGYRWAAPVRGVLLMLDGRLVPCRIFGRDATDWTVGPESRGCPRIPVSNADAYGAAMNEHGVELRFVERRRLLAHELERAAASLGAELLADSDLLRDRTVACETPGVMSLPLDRRFSGLPLELVQECLRERFGGFCAVRGEQAVGAVLVLDRPGDPEGKTAAAHEWALSTYLDDIQFFLERDRRRPLAEACREVEEQTLSATLGTFGERSRRCIQICDLLCTELSWQAERDRAREAIRLLAADSRTELRRAFPDLEGVIGGLLAREEGYPVSVWQAIADSRRTARNSRTMPRGRVGKLVAVSERLDRLTARIPAVVDDEGSGRHRRRVERLLDEVVRIGMAGRMPLDLKLAAAFALRLHQGLERGHRLQELLDPLNELVEEALSRVFREAGYEGKEIAAVLGADGSGLLSDQMERLDGLRSLRGDGRVERLGQTGLRLSGILQGSREESLDVGLLGESAERDLYHVYRRTEERIASALEAGEFAQWLAGMEELDVRVQRFLKEVLVRDENERLRQNRLALLQRVVWLYSGEIRLSEMAQTASAGPKDPGAAPRPA